MVVIEANVPSEKLCVDKNGVRVCDVYVPPPEDCCLNRKSRKYCPITDQQFEIARRYEGIDIESVRMKVLDILTRYNNINYSIFKE